MCLISIPFQICIGSAIASVASSSGQYHIQTDEGPERYFKYQTDNGQYRKEKRLQDGTVIGKICDFKVILIVVLFQL